MTAEKAFRVVIEQRVPAKMRDGSTLYADVYRPDVRGKFPALLLRTPYDRHGTLNASKDYGEYFAQRGYGVIIQDCRGCFESEGDFYALAWEAVDGFDSVEWAARLPWCTGKVGTIGQSYYGADQNILAPTHPPSLAAMVPISGPADFHESWSYHGGAFQLAWQTSYYLMLALNTARKRGLPKSYIKKLEAYRSADGRSVKDQWLRRLPLEHWSDLLQDLAPHLRDAMAHPNDGPHWWQVNVTRQHSMVAAPMYHVSSWYDIFQDGAVQNFSGITASGQPTARKSQKLLMGPWVHLTPYTVPTRTAGELDFGPDAAIEVHQEEQRWFDYWLKGVDNGVMKEPPVRIFVMGANRWRFEKEWPPKRVKYTPWYLHGNGKANTASGDGSLSPKAPSAEPADKYVYDPANPVPTLGGTTLRVMSGPYDQRKVGQRPDVLVYTSEPLARDIEVTGPVKVVLHASSSALDTDFTAKLVDVHPDGRAYNICDGILRARYRDSKVHPTLLEPGKAYQFTIDLWHTSNAFKKGHRIRVDVSSSNFPWYDRNPNTGAPFGQDDKLKTARQTVYHDKARPSHVLLPVIES